MNDNDKDSYFIFVLHSVYEEFAGSLDVDEEFFTSEDGDLEFVGSITTEVEVELVSSVDAFINEVFFASRLDANLKHDKIVITKLEIQSTFRFIGNS